VLMSWCRLPAMAATATSVLSVPVGITRDV
jgi:hypothetical protein